MKHQVSTCSSLLWKDQLFTSIYSVLLASAHPHDRAKRLLVMRIIIKSITEVMQERKNHLQNTPKKSWAGVAVCLLILPEPKDPTLDGDGPTKHHEHRWALLLMQFSLTNVVRTENVALGIDYVNPSDGWKLFPTKLSITDDYFCHPCSSEGKLRAEHMLRAKHRLLQEFLSQGLNLFLRMQCWFLTVEMSHEESKDRAETHLLLCWSEEEIFSPPRYFTPIATSSYQHLPSHSCVFKSRDITIIQE